MNDYVHWGVLGTGRIANKFAEGLRHAPGARLIAVGSRSKESAETFGDRHNVEHRHIGYEELAANPEVDVIYIGSPHTYHHSHTKLALDAGKNVLCEKPFTINATEATDLVRLARSRSLFLMEGMWTRFFPIMEVLRSLLEEKVIGEPQMLVADLGIRRTPESRPRLFAPELGGGALLDVGIYPISFASFLFGKPARIESLAEFGEYEVDEQAGILLGHHAGQLAILYGAIRTETPKEAIILGAKGSIRLHANFVKPSKLTLEVYGKFTRDYEIPIEGNGMHYEAIDVMNCLRAGAGESETMPLDESVSIMETMDAVRAQWGFVYPGEG